MKHRAEEGELEGEQGLAELLTRMEKIGTWKRENFGSYKEMQIFEVESQIESWKI